MREFWKALALEAELWNWVGLKWLNRYVVEDPDVQNIFAQAMLRQWFAREHNALFQQLRDEQV